AEPVHDLVRHEVGMSVPGAPVLAVVVALTAGDVVGQRARNGAGRAVAVDDVGDVVSHHPTEPAALLAHMSDVGTDVHRCGHADGDLVRIAAVVGGCLTHGADHPLCDVQVRQLQDEAV